MLKCVGCGKLTVDTCVGDTCGGKPFCGECSSNGDDVCATCFAAMPDDDIDDLDDDDLDDDDDVYGEFGDDDDDLDDDDGEIR